MKALVVKRTVMIIIIIIIIMLMIVLVIRIKAKYVRILNMRIDKRGLCFIWVALVSKIVHNLMLYRRICTYTYVT